MSACVLPWGGSCCWLHTNPSRCTWTLKDCVTIMRMCRLDWHQSFLQPIEMQAGLTRCASCQFTTKQLNSPSEQRKKHWTVLMSGLRKIFQADHTFENWLSWPQINCSACALSWNRPFDAKLVGKSHGFTSVLEPVIYILSFVSLRLGLVIV